MKLRKITILGGINKRGEKESVEKVDMEVGERIGIVGPTGSGKSQLLYDIERLANRDTKSKREILVNDRNPPDKFRHDPRNKIIGHLTQHMNFLTDTSVEDFLDRHINARGLRQDDGLIDKIIKDANKITGEPLDREMNLLMLSGGQSRALMAADVAYVSNSPIILVDEIESAGINKEKALDVLCTHDKIVFLVTHDPRLALNTSKRIVMGDGGMKKVIETSIAEKGIAHYFSWLEEYLLEVRDDVRLGRKVEKLKIICAPMKG